MITEKLINNIRISFILPIYHEKMQYMGKQTEALAYVPLLYQQVSLSLSDDNVYGVVEQYINIIYATKVIPSNDVIDQR